MNLTVAAVLIALTLPLASRAAEPSAAAGRAISASFAGELRTALEKALGEKGPVGAIGVCREEAPAIAARLSEEHGASVKRTGLRVRNPGNAPRPWELAALQNFEAQLARGTRMDQLELFESRPDGGARYLKAIAVQPLCLTCHGENIAPEVRAAITKHYPGDQATGFKVNDLRGAFSVEWPLIPHDPRDRDSGLSPKH
jgi:hypothetical protein